MYPHLAGDALLGRLQEGLDVAHDGVEILTFVQHHPVEAGELFLLHLLPAGEHELLQLAVGIEQNRGRRRFEEASRHIYASHAPLWDQRWRLILVVGELEPKVREQVRQALFWQGFGALGADCFVHPSAELSSVLDALIAEGLSSALGALLPLFAADSRSALSASDSDLVRRAWDLGVLAGAYGQFVATYQPILDDLRRSHLNEVSEQDAFLLRTLLIHDYRRLLLRDPELPEVLLPADWQGQQARLLCKELYKRLEAHSNRHLDQLFCLADGTVPAEDTTLPERFPQYDPLTP